MLLHLLLICLSERQHPNQIKNNAHLIVFMYRPAFNCSKQAMIFPSANDGRNNSQVTDSPIFLLTTLFLLRFLVQVLHFISHKHNILKCFY